MGLLKDLMEKKAIKVVENRLKQEVKESISDNHKITKYNRVWLAKVVEETGFALTDNKVRIDNILKKLNERDGHCPCGGMTEDFICPCKMMRTYGTCKCGLYKEYKDINPHGVSDARIKEDK